MRRGGRPRDQRRGRVIPFPPLLYVPRKRPWRARHTVGVALTLAAYALLYLWAADGASFRSPLLFAFSALCGLAFVCLND